MPDKSPPQMFHCPWCNVPVFSFDRSVHENSITHRRTVSEVGKRLADRNKQLTLPGMDPLPVPRGKE